MPERMKAQLSSVINTIRGKNLVGHITKEEIDKLLWHIATLEDFLDNADDEQGFHAEEEGWRYKLGINDE